MNLKNYLLKFVSVALIAIMLMELAAPTTFALNTDTTGVTTVSNNYN